jgi:hypothetical protein
MKTCRFAAVSPSVFGAVSLAGFPPNAESSGFIVVSPSALVAVSVGSFGPNEKRPVFAPKLKAGGFAVFSPSVLLAVSVGSFGPNWKPPVFALKLKAGGFAADSLEVLSPNGKVSGFAAASLSSCAGISLTGFGDDASRLPACVSPSPTTSTRLAGTAFSTTGCNSSQMILLGKPMLKPPNLAVPVPVKGGLIAAESKATLNGSMDTSFSRSLILNSGAGWRDQLQR